MKRFFIFPLILGICGLVFFPIFLVENILSQWSIFDSFGGPRVSSADYWMDTIEPSMNLSRSGLVAGVVTGFIGAVWDAVRNVRNETALRRLVPNLFWCGCFVAIIVAAYIVLSSVALSYNKPRWSGGAGQSAYTIMSLFTFATLLFNLTAIIWATVRSITTKDVLTPRVLRAKLRERARS